MSWNGIYAKDRYYPIFEPGDEVFTNKKNWKAITDNKPYIVVNCKGTHHSCVYIIMT